jgi:hypothetical protein
MSPKWLGNQPKQRFTTWPPNESKSDAIRAINAAAEWQSLRGFAWKQNSVVTTGPTTAVFEIQAFMCCSLLIKINRRLYRSASISLMTPSTSSGVWHLRKLV